MKKVIVILLLALMVLSCANGCGRRREDDVYYLNFKPEVADIYQRIASDYKKETGKTLRVVTAASGSYEQTLKSEIGKKNAPTIFQFNGPIGYRTWKNYCADLKNTEIYSALSDKSLAFQDENGVWGIPYVVEGYGIIYNKAITDAYFALPNRFSNVNSMDEIKSFAEFKSVVEDMSAHKEELGIEGVFASTSLKSGEDWRWTTHLANVPLHYEFQDNHTDLTLADGVKEIQFQYDEYFKNIFDLYLNHSVTDKKLLGSKQVADSMAEFALEKCAMVQNGNWAWSQIGAVAGNKVKKENIRMIPIFTGHESEDKQGICIGTENYLAINKNASEEKQKAAVEFLNWLYSSDTGKSYVINELNYIAPFSTFDETHRPTDPLSRQVMEWMSNGEVKNITWDFVVFPSQNFKETFGSMLLQYAQGNKTWEDVKKEFVEVWQAESNK